MALCPAQRIDDVLGAAFLDFAGRVRAGEAETAGLEDVLLAATRSAAAGHFELRPAPSARPSARASEQPICAAVPELLAASANHELRGDGARLREHVANCSTCAETAARIKRAEAAFAAARGW